MADRIDEIVGDKAFEQFDRLITQLDKSRTLFVDSAKAANMFTAAVGGAKSFKEYTQSVEVAEKKLNELRISQIKVQKEELQLQKVRDQITAKQLSNDQKSSRSITEQSRLYTQLSKTLEKLRSDAQDVGVRFGENSIQFQKAAERVRVVDTRLKSIDQQLGKSQRFVGEYERAGVGGFNRIGNSINQLTRELPAFTFSVQTGFLALSNNIPIFVDEIQRVRAEVKGLRADGKEVPGVMKQIAGSFFSWMTVMSVTITLLTIYGKEIGNFFAALFKGSEALKQFADNHKNLNEVYKTANQSAGEQIARLRILRATAQDVTLSTEQRLKAVRQLQEEFPKTYKALSDEIILNGQDKLATDELTKSIVAQAKARAALGKISEIEGKILDSEYKKEKIRNAERAESARVITGKSIGAAGFILDIESQRRDISKRAKLALDIEDQNQKVLISERDFLTKFAKLPTLTDVIIGDPEKTKKTGDTLRKDQLELNKARIEAAKEALQSIYTDETKSLNQRLAALNMFNEKSKELIGIDKAIQLTETELSSYKIKAIEERAKNDLLNLETETRNKKFDIQKQANDREVAENERIFNMQMANAKKADDEFLKQVALGMETRQSLYIQAADSELLALAEQYANGAMTAEQYAQRRLEIQHKLNQDLVNAEIEQIQFLIDIQKMAGKDTASEEKKLLELKQKYAKENTDYQINQLEKLRDKEAELIAKRKEIAQEFGNFAIAIVQGQFQQSEETLRKESESIDIKKAKDLEAVERSIASEQDKAAKIAIINAKSQSQKEAIERRQRQLELERARFEKQAGIARIIVDTASAVAQALPNIPLSLLVGALGAAQLATAIATPLPKFEDGGKMNYTGLAEYGHGTELRIDPDGKVSLTSNKPEIGVVKKGTEFISNKNLLQMLAKPEQPIYSGGQQISWSDLIASQKQTSKEVVNAVLSLKQQKQRGVGYYNTAKGQSYYQRNN